MNNGIFAKLSNIWYHYKWAILIALGFVIIFSVAFCQSASRITPDATMLYASTQALTVNEYNSINNDLQKIISKDYNGDGSKKLDIVQVSFNMFESETGEEKTFFNPTEQTTMKQRFDIELSRGTAVIYILDKALYNGIKDMLLPLESIIGYTPEQSEDGVCIEMSKLPGYYSTALKCFPEDNVICVRPIRTKGVLGGNDDEGYYNDCISVFKDIIEYKQ